MGANSLNMDVIEKKEKCAYCKNNAIALTENDTPICMTHFKEVKERQRAYIKS